MADTTGGGCGGEVEEEEMDRLLEIEGETWYHVRSMARFYHMPLGWHLNCHCLPSPRALRTDQSGINAGKMLGPGVYVTMSLQKAVYYAACGKSTALRTRTSRSRKETECRCRARSWSFTSSVRSALGGLGRAVSPVDLMATRSEGGGGSPAAPMVVGGASSEPGCSDGAGT